MRTDAPGGPMHHERRSNRSMGQTTERISGAWNSLALRRQDQTQVMQGVAARQVRITKADREALIGSTNRRLPVFGPRLPGSLKIERPYSIHTRPYSAFFAPPQKPPAARA